MLNELLIPEDLLQLEKLNVEIELNDEYISFLGLIGVDSKVLSLSFNNYFETFNNLIFHKALSSDIFNEILSSNEKSKFICINLFDFKDADFIQKLLFFRDFISDYNLKLIFILKKEHYNLIIRNAIDLYNISTFSYSFTTYKIEITDNFNKEELNNIIEEYSIKRKNLNKKQKISLLCNIGYKSQKYGEYVLGAKYLNEALVIAQKIKDEEYIMEIKHIASNIYRQIGKYSTAEKYILELLNFSKQNKNINSYKINLENLVLLYYDMNEFDKAIEKIEEMEKLSFEQNDKYLKLSALQNRVFIYEGLNDIKNENIYLEKAFILAKELNEEASLASLYQSKAITLLNEGLIHESMYNLNEALIIHKSKNQFFMICAIYNKIGFSYLLLTDYKKAFIYLNFSYNYFKIRNIDNILYQVLSNLSYYYFCLENYEESLNKSFEALNIVKKWKKHDVLADVYISISQIYKKLKDFDNGFKILNKIKIHEIRNNKILFQLFARYADNYCEAGNIDLAKEYFEKAEKLVDFQLESQKLFFKELKAEIFRKEKLYDEALLEFNDVLVLAKKKNDFNRIISIETNLAYLYKEIGNFTLSNKFFSEVIIKLKIINKNSKTINKLENEII